MRIELTGTAASPGMALGRARLVQATRHAIDHRPLAEREVAGELERLQRALETAKRELQELREKLDDSLAREVNELIDAHILLLNDGELLRQLEESIRVGRYRADAALKKQRDRLVAVFEAMDDPYLRSRREDIEQVLDRVISALYQRQASRSERRLAAQAGTILVADSIAPAELAQQTGHALLGIVSVGGSLYSHSTILARSLNLPMLVGTLEALDHLRDGELILLDAERGLLILYPTAADLSRYRAWQRSHNRQSPHTTRLASAPNRTADDIPIQLLANAELPEDALLACRHGANGIGLYRSEFLFMRRKGLPSEDEQFVAYRDLILAMEGRPVTIRTLDLGADKADAANLLVKPEENPALGVRGVRLSLCHPAVFTVQIRAILRAACYGPVQVLIPMVTQSDELIAVRSLFQWVREELAREGIAVPTEPLALGAMIEVPAAALNIRPLLAHADFLAIGSNDLIQYLLAADRGNEALANLYSPLQPALLRLLAYVIGSARRAGKPVSLCGEIGGDPMLTALLLALGLTQFSIHPGQLLPLRARLAKLNRGRLRQQLPQLLRANSTEEVEQWLAKQPSG